MELVSLFINDLPFTYFVQFIEPEFYSLTSLYSVVTPPVESVTHYPADLPFLILIIKAAPIKIDAVRWL